MTSLDLEEISCLPLNDTELQEIEAGNAFWGAIGGFVAAQVLADWQDFKASFKEGLQAN
ncbi:hypothetical protein [Dyadobacter luteus]|uniref:hypothetical protein n=1 Tax=Dyadobacter luteus TaxID=2259619 RepID=UPI0013142D33|nr:hypothetical protein [Dyadobacter luteus]